MKKITPQKALLDAIELLGGARATAERFGINRQAVYNWKYEKKVPIERAIRLEQLTSGAVTAEMLRPDVFK